MKSNIILVCVFASLLILSISACSFNLNFGSDFNFDSFETNGPTVRGSGNVFSNLRQVSSFDKVDMGARGKLVIELGDEEDLRIEAEDNILEYIETQVHDRTLEIRNSSNVNIEPTEDIRIYLTVKTLEALTVSGRGDVSVPSLEADRLSVNINSYGDLNIGNLSTELLYVNLNSFGSLTIENLNAQRLSVDISAMGNLVIQGGRVSNQEIYINDLGKYEASELDSDEAEVHISKLGSVTVSVTDFISAKISGSGTLHYIGSPIVHAEVIGEGTVEQVGN